MTIELLHQRVDGTDSNVVTRWLAAEGAPVVEGEALVEIEADKTVVAVPSPCSGTLVEIGADVGDELEDGDLLAVIDPGDGR